MRPHLQYHDVGALVGNLLLLPDDLALAAQIPLDLIGQGAAVHRQDGKNDADIDKRIDFDEHLQEKRARCRQCGNKQILIVCP